MRASVNGVELHYEVEGRGRPCIVLSPLGIAPFQHTLSRRLRDALRLIFVELRASGRSGGTLDEITIDVLLDDLEALRVALGIPSTLLMAHSGSALLALALAALHPESIDGVVGIAAPPASPLSYESIRSAHFERHASEERKALLREAEAAQRDPSATEEEKQRAWARSRLALTWFDMGFDTAEIEGLQIPAPRWVQKVVFELLLDRDLPATFERVRCPVFLALGVHDYLTPPVLWDEHRARIANLEVALFENAAHWPHVEEHERFEEALLAWLDRL